MTCPRIYSLPYQSPIQSRRTVDQGAEVHSDGFKMDSGILLSSVAQIASEMLWWRNKMNLLLFFCLNAGNWIEVIKHWSLTVSGRWFRYLDHSSHLVAAGGWEGGNWILSYLQTVPVVRFLLLQHWKALWRMLMWWKLTWRWARWFCTKTWHDRMTTPVLNSIDFYLLCFFCWLSQIRPVNWHCHTCSQSTSIH